MIRRSTWIVLVLLVALVGFSFYLRDREAKETAEATPTGSILPLLDGSVGEPTSIRLESSQGAAVQFLRDESGTWVLKEPEEAKADQAAAEAAASQISALRVLSTVKLGPEIIGLDHPQYTLMLGFTNSVEHKLRIGDQTPIQDGYYAQLDDGAFQVVDKTGMDPLIALLTGPPYLETPTAPATATSQPSSTPETTSTGIPTGESAPSSGAEPDASVTSTP